jgi:hypothetical protein
MPLIWEALDGRRACRIRSPVEGGYRSDPEEWDEIQDQVVERMNRLAAAIRPELSGLQFT